MSNLELYREIFINCLMLEEDTELEELSTSNCDEWDSFVHVEMLSQMEKTFQIKMTKADIFQFSSYKSGIEILIRKGIELD